uniref:Uncharacterized protein n=1 Tax=Fundulus heteroclitus TaxID=8078 RepID=A0A3Q2QBT9_FUNHE
MQRLRWTHVAEDHGLSDGDGSIDVTEGLELLLLAVAEHKVLLDGVQRLLLPLQLDDVGVGHDALGNVSFQAGSSLPLDPDALVLVSLRGDHDVGFVQHKHSDLLGIYKLEFTAPVQHCAGLRTNIKKIDVFQFLVLSYGMVLMMI